MAINISEKQIPHVLDILYKHLPASSLTYLPLKYVLAGSLERHVWVDQWPDCRAVLLTPKHWNRDNTKMNILSIFALENSKLEDILKKTGIIEEQRLFALGLPEDNYTSLEAHLLRDPKSHFIVPELYQLRTATMWASEIHYDGSLPTSFTVRKLTRKDGKMIGAQWFRFPGSEDYIIDCISVTELAICVMNENCEPIAWSVKHIYGAIGFTFVLPRYRGNGLGKYVTAALAREIIAADGFCVACVEPHNIPSVKIHEDVGFKTTDICSTFTQFQVQNSSKERSDEIQDNVNCKLC